MRRQSIRARYVAQLLTVATAGLSLGSCSGAGDVTSGSETVPAASLTSSAATIFGAMGQNISTPLVISVVDAHGNRVSTVGRLISLAIENSPSGVNLLGSSTATVDAAGDATFNGIAVTGPLGSLALIASSPGLTSVRIPLSMSAGTPSRIDPVSSLTVRAVANGQGPPLVVVVNDQWLNRVAGTTVSFSISGTTLGVATSGSDGKATLTTWSAPAVGSYQVAAAIAGGPSVQLNLTTNIVASLINVPIGSVTYTVTKTARVNVSVLDAQGNPLSNAIIAWSTGTSGGTATSDETGIAPITATMPTKTGTVQLAVSAGTVSTTFSLQVTPDAVARITAAGTEIVGAAGSIQDAAFTVYDQWGNVIPNTGIDTVKTTGTGMSPSQGSVLTDGNGVGVFKVKMGANAGTGSIVVRGTQGPFVGASIAVRTTAQIGTLQFGDTACVIPLTNYATGSLLFVTAHVFGPDGKTRPAVPVAFSGQGLIFTTLPTKLPPDSYDYAPRVVTTDSSGSAGIFWWTGGIFGSYSVMATTPAGFDALSPATFTCVVPMPDTRPLISH